MQTFYHGLISSTHESIDAAARGAFLSLKLSDAKALVEKMASNSTCNEECTQSRKKGGGIHHLKEANMVTAKLDLIIKKLDIEKKEVMHINDSHMTCEECGDYGHSATSCPTLQEDLNFINNNTYYRPQQNQGWNQQPRQGNYQGNNQGNNFNNNFLPLRELVASQSKLLDQMTRKLASNDKPLENIHTRMDTFANLVDIHNATQCYIESADVQWIDHSLPEKMGEPGRPVIPISIGCHSFQEAICDFGASVNIMPKVIYEKKLNDPLLYTNMHL